MGFHFRKWHTRASTCILLTWSMSFGPPAVTASVAETVNKERGLRSFRPASLQKFQDPAFVWKSHTAATNSEAPAWIRGPSSPSNTRPYKISIYWPLFLRENRRETFIWSWDTKWMSSPQTGLLTSEETEILSTGQIRACLPLTHSLLWSSRFVTLKRACEKVKCKELPFLCTSECSMGEYWSLVAF